MKQVFFPPVIFDDPPEFPAMNQFLIDWYSGILEELNEPSLYALAGDAGFHIYRFLWLRTFHLPIAVQLYIEPTGNGVVVAKLAGQQQGDKPGEIVFDQVLEQARSLSPQQVSEFLSQLKTIDFWNLPTPQDVRGRDGSLWILEGVHHEKYHVLNRWSPRTGQFRETALSMVRLAAIAVEQIY